MGYTSGRKHTEESLREIAKLYNTKSDFQKSDSGAYSSAARRGRVFLESICEHMVKSYSTPQLICKNIMDQLLGVKCLYNTRQIITPYELDLYFPEFKLAIEYNGKGWHTKEDVIKRDNHKILLCAEKEINLIIIEEKNRNYEQDIKTQLIDNLNIINKLTNNTFSSADIENIKCSVVFDDIFKTRNIEEIQDKIKKVSSIKEFKELYKSEYNFLNANKKLHLLNKIRQTKEDTEEEILEKCKKISDMSTFINHNRLLYQKCVRRNLLEKATAHMHRTNKKYRNHTDEDLLSLANKFKMKSYLKKGDTSLFLELKKRNILNLVTYEPNFVYKHTKTIIKEKAIEKCFEDAKKYNNYNDFKNDKDLYDRCVKYNLIKKVSENFIKEDISQIILEESKKYKNFEDFTESIWYRRTKNIKGLIQQVKAQNNWSSTKKGKLDYIQKFSKIVEMINEGTELDDIVRKTQENKTTLWRIKKQMHETGILKVGYNPRK